MIQPAFWKGRRVLVTGHTGFKGGWLSLWLQTMGAEVIGYALPPATQPNLFEIARVGQKMESILADIRDANWLHAAFSTHQPEVVFHLAAQAEMLPAYSRPVETYSTNVMGTVNVLEAVRQNQGVRAVVVVTSDKCYENRESRHAYREGDSLGGADPYSSSKGCAELVTAAYRSSFFKPVDHAKHGTAIATARAGNAIGGGDWSANRLIPDAIRAFVDKRPLQVRHPAAIRPWQHVLEPLAGYLMLAEQLVQQGASFADAWNFGPSDENAPSVEQLLDALGSLWGDGTTWEHDRNAHPHEAQQLRLDASKAISMLHWQPRWSLGSALRMTVAWHHAHLRGEDMAAVSSLQINRYCRATSNVVMA